MLCSEEGFHENVNSQKKPLTMKGPILFPSKINQNLPLTLDRVKQGSYVCL